MAWTWAYLHPAFLSLRCTYKDWTIKSFPWKQVKFSRYGQNVWKINGKEYRVPLGERKLDCTLTKEPQNYISYFVWYGVTMFKIQQLKPYKRYKQNICSFQKVHNHSLIQKEVVSTFILKKSNYISFIVHSYRNNEKSNIRNTLGCIFVLNGPYLWCKNSLLGWYSQFGNLTLWFALFRSHAIY